VIAWMVGNDPDTAATYNRAQSEAAHDAARRWGCSITGLISCGPEFDAPAPPAAPIAQGTDDTTAVMTPFGPMVPPAAPGQPPYPEGNVIGPCVCGSWPGGPCLRCKWIPAPPAPTADLCKRLRAQSGKAFGPWELCLEAASALEAMQDENARLAQIRNDIGLLLVAAQKAKEAAEARALELEARSAQLLFMLAQVRDSHSQIIINRVDAAAREQMWRNVDAAIDAARKEGER